MFFEYGDKETDYLKSKDANLALVIEKIGHINRTIDNDLFSSIVHHIIGQQISSKAQQTIWKKMNEAFGVLNPIAIDSSSIEQLHSFGITYRKAEYIKDLSLKITKGEFNLESIRGMNDEEAISVLKSLKGVGTWTAEMILLFCLQHSNVLSFDDFGIRRGMQIVYDCPVNKEFFKECRNRLSPYCSVASLYFWEVAGGALS